LQAADFYAWHIREWYERGAPETDEGHYLAWIKTTRDIPRVEFTFDEDQIVAGLKSAILAQLGPGTIIKDERMA
jgi:hypothetical protein